MWALSCSFLMKNMFIVTTVLSHNLLQTNTCIRHKSSESARHTFTMWALNGLFLMKNMFNVTIVLPHNLLQTNPCIRHNFSAQVFRKRAAQLYYVGHELRYISWPPRRPGNIRQLRAHIVKLCRALSEDLCRKVVTNARVRLQEVVRQNGGHIEHVLHYEQFSSL